MNLFRFVLIPFSILYGLISWFRNWLYNNQFLKSESFGIPVICVGNLSLGGTGKSPAIEYLVRWLDNDYNIAILSRGYKRSTKGFVVASDYTTTLEIGDEPMQFKKKFSKITVAVDEKRKEGIQQLLKIDPTINLILLDDAFQHRAVRPSLSILLTDYEKPFYKDFLIPVGSLRESKKGKNRADIIVVTKCPSDLDEEVKRQIIAKINPKNNQKVFFSRIVYKSLVSCNEKSEISIINKKTTVVLFAGIANVKPLKKYLDNLFPEVILLQFSDHHYYSETDMEKIKNLFLSVNNENKIIVTTEKDFVRLLDPKKNKFFEQLPFFYLPIEMNMIEKNEFEKEIVLMITKSLIKSDIISALNKSKG